MKETLENKADFDVGAKVGLSPAERERWNGASRKRGRPKTGEGFKRVSVSLEQGQLNRVTALAKKSRISRSMLVGRALEQALAQKK